MFSSSPDTTPPRILIMGVGNVLLCDEGFGVRAVAYLEEHYDWPENVQFLAGETGGIMLMPEIQSCDLLVVVGSSLVVYPAAGLVRMRSRAANLIIINKDPTPYDRDADLVLHEDISEVFSAL